MEDARLSEEEVQELRADFLEHRVRAVVNQPFYDDIDVNGPECKNLRHAWREVRSTEKRKVADEGPTAELARAQWRTFADVAKRIVDAHRDKIENYLRATNWFAVTPGTFGRFYDWCCFEQDPDNVTLGMLRPNQAAPCQNTLKIGNECPWDCKCLREAHPRIQLTPVTSATPDLWDLLEKQQKLRQDNVNDWKAQHPTPPCPYTNCTSCGHEFCGKVTFEDGDSLSGGLWR